MDSDFAASLRAKKTAAAKENAARAKWQSRKDQLDIAVERLRGVCSRPDIQSATERTKLVRGLLEFGKCCRHTKIADRVQLLAPKSDVERFVVDVVSNAIAGRKTSVSDSLREAGEDFENSDVVQIARLLGDVGWRLWQSQPIGCHNTMKDIREYFALQVNQGDIVDVDGFWYWQKALTDEAKAWQAVHQHCFDTLQPQNLDELWSSILALMDTEHHISAETFWKMRPAEVANLLLPKESGLPEWMEGLTHDRLLDQCFKLKREWPLPGIGAVNRLRPKVRELLAGLTMLQVATPANMPVLPTFAKQVTTENEEKHHDDFCTSVDLIISAIQNSKERLTGAAIPTTPPPPKPPKPDALDPPIVLNDTLLGIMKELDGRALRVEALAKLVTGGEPNRLYRDGMKTVLEANGFIVLDRRIGWYRPDRPPPDRIPPAAKLRVNK